MKMQFTTFEHWPGVVSCLNNIKSIIKENYPSVQIRTRNFSASTLSFSTIKELKFEPPDYLFVGGWDNNIKTIVQNVSQKTKVILMWCSPITQIELGGEMTRFFDVLNFLNTKQITYLALPLDTDCESLKFLNERIVYFPIFMDTIELDGFKVEKNENSDIISDIFCAPCSRKNILSQIIALSHHNVKLHTNYQVSNSNSIYLEAINRVLKKSENYGWLNREEYLKKLQQSDFGMQVSLSESFNYVAAEHMYFGIPVIISNIVPYSSFSEINELVVDDHQNVYKISKIIKKLLDKDFRLEFGNRSKYVIEKYNNQSKEILFNSIKLILEEKV